MAESVVVTRKHKTDYDEKYDVSYHRITVDHEGYVTVAQCGETQGAFDVADKDTYAWLERCMYEHETMPFKSIGVWALVMVVLQIAALLMIAFEYPGVTDERNVILYISNNIAMHQGFGGVMVLAFAGSMLMSSMITTGVPGAMTLYVCVALATCGGAGVVMFHGTHGTEHLICAAGFIVAGLLIHAVIIFTGPWRIRHGGRDIALLVVSLLSAGTFGIVLMWVHFDARYRNDLRKDEFARFLAAGNATGYEMKYGHPLELLTTRDRRYDKAVWLSGIAEYVLYTNMCALNVFTGQRVLEHTAFFAQQQIVTFIDRDRSV